MSKSKKFFSAALMGTTVLWSLGAALLPVANAQSTSSIQAQIQALLNQISALQAQLGTSSTGTVTPAHVFTVNLTVGSKGDEVKALQQYLIDNHYLTIATPTGFYGQLTKKAVAAWQAAVGISPTAGVFGPKSRAYLNSVLAGGTTSTGGTTTTPAAAGLTVSLASDSPASGSIVAGQSIADLGHFVFANGGSAAINVTSLKVNRIGVSSDNTLTNVYLYNGNTKLTDAGSLSAGVITFSNPNGVFTVPAMGSLTISVKSDILGGVSGQTVGVSIASASNVVSNASAVNGNFPVNSLLQTVANVSDLATAQFTTVTSPASSIQAGTTNVTVWSDTLTVGTRAVKLSYLRLQDIGSAPSDALQNIGLYVDGTKVSSGVVNGGYVVFDMTATPVSLSTGGRLIEVHADVVKGSSLTFSFSLQTKSDIALVDSQYGVNIALGGSNVPPLTTSQTTISAGSVTVQLDPTFSQTQITKNSSNVTLGQWTMKAYGEDVRVQSLVLVPGFTGTVPTGDGFNNLAIYVNGAMVGSSQNYIATASNTFPTLNTYGSGNLFTIPAGTTVTVSVKGDTVVNGSESAEQMTLRVPANTFQGLSSFTTTPGTQTDYTGQNLSYSSGNLTVAKNTAYTDQSIAPNVTGYKIGSFVLQAGNAESVRVSNLQISLATTSPMQLTNVANLYVTDNTTPVNPSATNNFSVNYTLTPGQTKTVDVFADLGSATGTLVASLKVTATGVSTGASLGNSTAVAGQTITPAAGTVAVPTLDGSAPLSALVIGGTSPAAATFKLVASNGNATIQELRFTVTDGSGATSTAIGNAVTSVAVGNASAPVVYDGQNNYAAYLTGLNINVPVGNQGYLLNVTPTFNTVGTNAATTGQQVKVNLAYVKYQVGNTVTDMGATGYSSNSTSSFPIAANPMVVAASKPTINKASDSPVQSSGYAQGLGEALRFTVTADANGPVYLRKFTVTPTYSITLTSTTQKMYVYDSNDLSTVLASTTIGASGTADTFTLNADYGVAANQTRELVVKADTTGTGASGTSFRLDLTSSDAYAAPVALGSAGNWAWNDGTTATAYYMGGYLVKNLPVYGNNLTK